MRTVRIHEAAAAEAEEAAAWYEQKQLGLGADFVRSLHAALELLQDDLVPDVAAHGQAGRRKVRRLILKRFPYDVVFINLPDCLLVLAFVHHARGPGFWRERLGVLDK